MGDMHLTTERGTARRLADHPPKALPSTRFMVKMSQICFLQLMIYVCIRMSLIGIYQRVKSLPPVMQLKIFVKERQLHP
ncbi:hypothetical protein C5167_018277 [Papaver somniferum]|uniref:Uncharacterized protein n=1 Tax=Papaver somniferum TaxID=3469 RepID=A0A4Y7ILU1_PAPSO|nr:hypothetical protein C5167_018277 [Papaver somniferum]